MLKRNSTFLLIGTVGLATGLKNDTNLQGKEEKEKRKKERKDLTIRHHSLKKQGNHEIISIIQESVTCPVATCSWLL